MAPGRDRYDACRNGGRKRRPSTTVQFARPNRSHPFAFRLGRKAKLRLRRQRRSLRQVLDRRDRIFYPGDTEHLKPLGRKLVLNVLLDQKEIFTGPFHMTRESAKLWSIFRATTTGLIAADRHIANSFENGNERCRRFMHSSRIVRGEGSFLAQI